MISNYKVCIKIVLFSYYMSFLTVLIPSSIYSQEKFLLTTDEMLGYELHRQSNRSWEIGENQRNDRAIEQVWIKSGTNVTFVIQYCEFESLPEAISGTAYKSQSYSIPAIWGSLNGIIKGDEAWVFSVDRGMFFTRGNIGINIGGPSEFTEVERNILIEISDKIFNKIENNLKKEILDAEVTAKNKQITESDYQTMINPVETFKMDGFNNYSVWNSKWTLNSINFAMGIRKEWINRLGAVVGIDLCKFDSEMEAKSATEIQAKNSYCCSFNFDNLDSLRIILEKWKNTPKNFFAEYNFSVIGIKNNIAFHFYKFDTTGINTDSIYSLIEVLSKAVVNFLITSVAGDEGQAAEVNFKTFVLKQNYPNPFNASTIIGYVLQKPNNISLKVFDINGREVITLVNDFQSAGNYQIQWNGNDTNGKPVSSGTYIYTLKTETLLISKTMTLLK